MFVASCPAAVVRARARECEREYERGREQGGVAPALAYFGEGDDARIQVEVLIIPKRFHY